MGKHSVNLRKGLAIGAGLLMAAGAQANGCQTSNSNATPGTVVDRGPNSAPYVIKYRRITDHKEVWVDVDARVWADCVVGSEYPNCGNR